MFSFPMHFKGHTRMTLEQMTTPHETESSGYAFHCHVPKEFHGTGGAPSPEDFYALALANCLMSTLKVYLVNSKITVESLENHFSLEVAPDENGKPIMKAIHFDLHVKGASHPDRVERLIQKTLESGFILNSVKTKVHANTHFV